MFHCLTLRNVLSLAFIVGVMMASTDMNNFFPDINGNLTKITWAHAVNEHSYLIDVLNNEDIMMIEGDILLGQLDGVGAVIPIMCHPPNITSNLSLLTFLLKVKQFNSNETNTKKGVKLDFKSIEVFLASLSTLQIYDQDQYPIWINADILPGPINSTTTPVDADQFLTNTKLFPNSTLSIGWTTLYGSNYSGSYDSDQIQNMVDVIQKNNVSQDITFPVRAGLAAESIELLADLVKSVDGSTITIWSSEGDNVDVDHLRQLIAKVGISKVYVDVPSDLLDKLHLDNLPNSSATLGFSMLGIVISVCLNFVNNYFRI